MLFHSTSCRRLERAIPKVYIASFLRTLSTQAISKRATTSPAVPVATKSTRIRRRPDIAQKICAGKDDLKQQDDLFSLFETFANSQTNYERYGGRNLFRYTYDQHNERFNALSADFTRMDKQLLINYMAQHPDFELFRRFKEIADLRREYVRTVGSKGMEQRTDESAARLRAEGFLTGLPRLFRSARRETRMLKQARKQSPYTSRSSQLMREETKQAMQNAPFLQKVRLSLSPEAQAKEQLRVLMRWIKLSETDKLSPKPFLAPSSRQYLQNALEETHRLKLYHTRGFQVCREVCKAVSIVLACAFFAWKAGSGLVARWGDSNRQAALEEVLEETTSSASVSSVTADSLPE